MGEREKRTAPHHYFRIVQGRFDLSGCGGFDVFALDLFQLGGGGEGFNSVFRRRNEREIRTKGEREGIDHEQARHAFKINYVREGVRNASPRLVAFDTTLETRYVVVYNEN